MRVTRTCSLDGCPRSHYARGWCEGHYKRWKAGRPIEGPITARAAKGTDPLIRVLSRLVDDGDCRIWTGARSTNGYGEIMIDERPRPVHRIVYERLVGPIPAGMYVCHHCDNRVCCHPAHLFVGTQKDNMIDMMAKGRGRGQFGSQLKYATPLNAALNVRTIWFGKA